MASNDQDDVLPGVRVPDAAAPGCSEARVRESRPQGPAADGTGRPIERNGEGVSLFSELFDTPDERREFVRHILIGLSTALLAVYIAKHSKVI